MVLSFGKMVEAPLPQEICDCDCCRFAMTEWMPQAGK